MTSLSLSASSSPSPSPSSSSPSSLPGWLLSSPKTISIVPLIPSGQHIHTSSPSQSFPPSSPYHILLFNYTPFPLPFSSLPPSIISTLFNHSSPSSSPHHVISRYQSVSSLFPYQISDPSAEFTIPHDIPCIHYNFTDFTSSSDLSRRMLMFPPSKIKGNITLKYVSQLRIVWRDEKGRGSRGFSLDYLCMKCDGWERENMMKFVFQPGQYMILNVPLDIFCEISREFSSSMMNSIALMEHYRLLSSAPNWNETYSFYNDHHIPLHSEYNFLCQSSPSLYQYEKQRIQHNTMNALLTDVNHDFIPIESTVWSRIVYTPPPSITLHITKNIPTDFIQSALPQDFVRDIVPFISSYTSSVISFYHIVYSSDSMGPILWNTNEEIQRFGDEEKRRMKAKLFSADDPRNRRQSISQIAIQYGFTQSAYLPQSLFYCIPIFYHIMTLIPSSLLTISTRQKIFLLPIRHQSSPHEKGIYSASQSHEGWGTISMRGGRIISEQYWQRTNQQNNEEKAPNWTEDREEILSILKLQCDDKGAVDLKQMALSTHRRIFEQQFILFVSCEDSNLVLENYYFQPFIAIRDTTHERKCEIEYNNMMQQSRLFHYYAVMNEEIQREKWGKWKLKGRGRWISPVSNMEYQWEIAPINDNQLERKEETHRFDPSLVDHSWPHVLHIHHTDVDILSSSSVSPSSPPVLHNKVIEEKRVIAAIYCTIGQLFPLSDDGKRLSQNQREMLQSYPLDILSTPLRKLRDEEKVHEGEWILVGAIVRDQNQNGGDDENVFSSSLFSFPKEFHSAVHQDFLRCEFGETSPSFSSASAVETEVTISEWLSDQFQDSRMYENVLQIRKSLSCSKFVPCVAFYCPSLEEKK